MIILITSRIGDRNAIHVIRTASVKNEETTRVKKLSYFSRFI